MFPVLIGLGIVAGIVALAANRPRTDQRSEEKKLANLKRTPVSMLTLDMAEDGLVLSRRFSDREAVKRFEATVSSIKQTRGPV